MDSNSTRADIRNRVILALDVPAFEEALELVRLTKEYIGMYKVGMELFYSAGVGVVRAIIDQGVQVFLDLKLHDIPQTVERTSRVLSSIGVAMINVHCMGGKRMMRAAATACQDTSGKAFMRTKVLGVTILTSLTEAEVADELGIRGTLTERVRAMALLAKESGLDGVVASPHEISVIKDACGSDFLVVTPGVRPKHAGSDDQRRVMTPGQAIASGADYIVIGRPITRSRDPRAAAALLLDEAEKEVEALKCLRNQTC
ncbi:MAG: orotidine-5'-phosphate decarboxylase [Bacillota bacterium]|jgi:orotidine-5'-phosphate decarboxylase